MSTGITEFTVVVKGFQHLLTELLTISTEVKNKTLQTKNETRRYFFSDIYK